MRLAAEKFFTARRGITLIVMSIVAPLAWVSGFLVYATLVDAGTVVAASLCGDVSVPDYGFTHNL